MKNSEPEYLVVKKMNKIYEGLKKSESYHAVKNADFSIQKGELVIFVGPSGCGKSTFLRMIAGLEDISAGDLLLEGESIKEKDAKDRNVSMVFQDYALYPHMTVKGNLSFGLENEKVPKDKIKQKVAKIVEILELKGLENRFPSQLSGGQRQRVALGRAIIKEPKVFLLDEPLSNLDAKLRSQTRRMIANLHQKLGATMIYVTHDQIEAMTLGDKIVVMEAGAVQQIDTPEKIYHDPANVFVATFIGSPPMNIFAATMRKDGQLQMDENWTLSLTEKQQTILQQEKVTNLLVGIRPEHIELRCQSAGETGGIQPNYIEFLGSENLLYFSLFKQEITVKVSESKKLSEHDTYHLSFPSEKLYLFDAKTTKRVG